MHYARALLLIINRRAEQENGGGGGVDRATGAVGRAAGNKASAHSFASEIPARVNCSGIYADIPPCP